MHLVGLKTELAHSFEGLGIDQGTVRDACKIPH